MIKLDGISLLYSVTDNKYEMTTVDWFHEQCALGSDVTINNIGNELVDLCYISEVKLFPLNKRTNKFYMSVLLRPRNAK